jgi:hypothetical protein
MIVPGTTRILSNILIGEPIPRPKLNAISHAII